MSGVRRGLGEVLAGDLTVLHFVVLSVKGPAHDPDPHRVALHERRQSVEDAEVGAERIGEDHGLSVGGALHAAVKIDAVAPHHLHLAVPRLFL